MRIHTTFDITDTDSTLKYLYVALIDLKGNEIEEKTLNPSVREINFDIIDPGKYKVLIKANYEALDGEEHTRDEIKVSDEIAEITPNAKVIKGNLSNKYPQKDEIIDVTYEIAGNLKYKPIKATINEKQEYDLVEVPEKENTYKISYKVSNLAGPEDIDLTDLHFENEQIMKLEEPYELQVDVLKDVPQVTVTSTEMIEQNEVIFYINVTDEDDAMIAGEANVHDEHKEIKKGTNTMPVKVDLDTEHTLNVNIDYDLDSNKDDDQNKSRISHSQVFALVKDFELKINNLRAVQKDTDTPVKYVNKADQIQLRFDSTNKTTLIPQRIYLTDNRIYDVHKVEGTQNEYYIDVTANSNPGVQKFEIEQVELSSSQIIEKEKINQNTEPVKVPEVTVLKEKPTMEEYNSTNAGTSVTVTFNIKDLDKALLKDSKIKLLDLTTNTEKISYNINNGLNTHIFDNLEPGKKYQIIVENNYSLSDDGVNDGKEIFKNETIEITKIDESNFKVKNLRITERVQKGNKVQVSFENAVMSYKDVDTVTIDDVEYDVSNSKDEKGVYTLTFDPKQKGVNTIQVQYVKIDGKEFPINRPLSYTYELEVPEAINVTEIEENGGKAIINYKLKDTENSINKLTAYMKTSSGAVVAKVDVLDYKADEKTINKVEMPLMKLNRYSVELRATCDIGDGLTLEDKTLFEKNIDSPSQAAIIENTIDKEYVEKGEEVTLTFKLNTNVDSDVKKIYINEEQYNVEKVLDENKKVIPDTYTVKVEAPKTSGVFPQKVTGIEIGVDFLTEKQEGEDGRLTYSSELKDNIVPIKVLKDTPTVTHFAVDEQKGNVTFKVNDRDEALLDNTPSKFVVKKGEQVIKTTDIGKRKSDYKVEQYNGSDYTLNLKDVGISSTSYPEPYNIEINSTYDRRPDAPQETNIFKKILSFFTGNKNEVKTIANENTTEGGEETEPEEDVIKEKNIFKRDITLVGDIKYNIDFDDDSWGYMFTLTTAQNIWFDCSTGTPYKVSKVIIDGEEYPVEVYKDLGNNKYKYQTSYIAKSHEQDCINYERIILENGAAFDVKDSVMCMVVQAEPTFSMKTFSEDLQARKVRFGYKFVDEDGKVKDKLTFTLSDSQGKTLGTVTPERDQNMVEFEIPDPPTSVYKLTVTGDKYEMPGSDWTHIVTFYSGEYKSSVTTSILSTDIKNKYPKKGETIEIIYNISSTRVILVDKEDHSNQDKAVSISKMLINGELYNVEVLDAKDYGPEKYRIYYTAKNSDGIENIDVSRIYFSNGEDEEFLRTDQIDVLKDVPEVTDFRTENNLTDKKVTFKFNVSDKDNVIVDDYNDIYVEINGKKYYDIKMGENTIVANINDLDKVLKFEVKAKYDLDSDKLQTDKDENSYEDYTIFEKPFILTGQYGMQFSDIKKINSKGQETEFFEKNDDIKVQYKCQTSFEGIYTEVVTINGQKYIPERVENEENTYFVTIKASNQSGTKDIVFNSATLNSGNEIQISNQKTTYEVLKDPVTVENFTYSIGSDNDKVNLNFIIKDDDKANRKLQIEIKDENDTVIEPNIKDLKVGENSFDFERTSAGKYFVSIYSTYDRDTNEANSQNDVISERIHYEIITVNTRYIEMKDILDIELYTYDEKGNVQRVDSLSKDNLSVLDNCVVKVTMKDLPEFYSNIKSYSTENNKLKLLLQYEDAMVYTGDEELKPLEVTLNLQSDNSTQYQYEKSFKSLVDEMRAHPTETFNLTKDYDLTEYQANNDETSQSIIDFEFQGKINGNGHRIFNAKKPLFNTLKNATIENLIIDGPEPIILNNTAILTKIADNTIIRNVHIERPQCNYTGTSTMFAINLQNNSLIENCSVTDLKGNFSMNSQQNSSIAVFVTESTIKNCYVQGYMKGGWHFNGGICRRADKDSKICNVIFNVNYAPFWGNDMGGNACLVYDANGVILQNNLCLVQSSNAKTIYYNYTPGSESKNNCQLQESTAPKNEDGNGVRTISKKDITADFLRNELEYSDDIWNIPADTSFDKLPTLKGFSVAYSDEGEKPQNAEVYIPDYNRVARLKDYKPEREIIYNNMYKLMPFYDAKELINDGNKVPLDNPLATKLISYIVPFNKEGKMVSHLTTENYDSLDKIKIVFKDGTGIQYHIDFDDYYGEIASYMISELKIGYNYNKYVINPNLTIIQELINEAQKYDFNNDLAPLTTSIEEDSRLYKEHFENVTKNCIPEFVINTIVNSGYNLNFESDLVNTKIRQELYKNTNSTKLKQLLFAYNYFTKWYNLDMQGLNVADAIMFHGTEIFDSRMTFENLSGSLITGEYSKTNSITNYYNTYVAPYTRLDNLGLFLDHFIKGTTTYRDGDDWFRETFKGGIYEAVSIGHEDEVDYTIWDHVKRDGKVQRDILPLLTVPENSAFVISCPTQVYYGSLRVYITDPNDPVAIEKFREDKIKLFLDHIKQFYVFGYNYWGAETLNKYCDTEYDMRTTYTGRGNETIYNNPYTTEENYHKYFIEAIDRWAGTSGGAYANGNEVFWNVIKMLDGGFRVGTHETLHNQDSKVFMNGYGRRGNAEDYAAGFLQQYYRDGWVSPNVFDEEASRENTTQNLHRSTVETNEKLSKFYKNYFRANDFLDYIEAQAFFQLNDSEKAKLATQVYYPKTNDQEAGDDVVEYRPVTEDAVKNMKLTDMKALWDNRIMLRPGVVEPNTHSPGADTDSIFNIHWYQPHADDDRPDGGSFKYNAWQMAGERGYYDGLCAYYSLSYIGKKQNNPSLKTTDSIAIKYITGKNSFREYKLDRYNELSQYFNKVGTYINAKEIYDAYLSALKEDASRNDRNLTRSTNVKRNLFMEIREATNDFTIDPLSDMTKASTIKADTELKKETLVLPTEKSKNNNENSKESTKKDSVKSDVNATNSVKSNVNVTNSSKSDVNTANNVKSDVITQDNKNNTSSVKNVTNSTNSI